MIRRALTRSSTVLALAGILALALHAGPAPGAPNEKAAAAPPRKPGTRRPRTRRPPATRKRTRRKPRRRPARQDRQDRRPVPTKSAAAKAQRRQGGKAVAAAMPSPLPPAELAALKEAVAAARKGSLAGRRPAKDDHRPGRPQAGRMGDPAQRREREHRSQPLHGFLRGKSRPGPRWSCCAAAPRRRCGRTAAIRPSCAPISPRSGRPPPRADLRSPARCSCRATAPARKAWCGRPGATTTSRAISKIPPSMSSGTCSRRADHKARMDIRLYAEDAEGAMRSANRAGSGAVAIAKARIAVIKKASNAKALLDALPAETRRDIGVVFSRVQLLRRDDKAAEAAELILSLPNDPAQAIDPDQWWIERRLISRKMLDLGDAKAAYRIASGAALPNRDNYRAREPVHGGLDRAALPQRSGDRARPFREDRQRHQQPDHAGAQRLLAGPRGGGARPRRRGARTLRGRGTLLDRLLRPARTRKARSQGHRRAAAS